MLTYSHGSHWLVTWFYCHWSYSLLGSRIRSEIGVSVSEWGIFCLDHCALTRLERVADQCVRTWSLDLPPVLPDRNQVGLSLFDPKNIQLTSYPIFNDIEISSNQFIGMPKRQITNRHFPCYFIKRDSHITLSSKDNSSPERPSQTIDLQHQQFPSWDFYFKLLPGKKCVFWIQQPLMNPHLWRSTFWTNNLGCRFKILQLRYPEWKSNDQKIKLSLWSMKSLQLA